MSSGVLLSCIVSWTARVLDQWGSSWVEDFWCWRLQRSGGGWWRLLWPCLEDGTVSVTITGGCWCVWASWWCWVQRPGVHRYLTELFPHWLRKGTMDANGKWRILATWHCNQGWGYWRGSHWVLVRSRPF